MCSDEKINLGTILSYDVVCAGSPVIIMLQKSKQTNKYKEFLFSFSDHVYIEKSRETREVVYT